MSWCVTNPVSFLAADEDRFTPQPGFGKRTIEGAPRFPEAGAFKCKVETFALSMTGAAQSGVGRIVQAHHQELFHRKAGRAFSRGEAEPLVKRRQRIEIEIVQMMRRGYPPFGKRERRAGAALERCEIIGHVDA